MHCIPEYVLLGKLINNRLFLNWINKMLIFPLSNDNFQQEWKTHPSHGRSAGWNTETDELVSLNGHSYTITICFIIISLVTIKIIDLTCYVTTTLWFSKRWKTCSSLQCFIVFILCVSLWIRHYEKDSQFSFFLMYKIDMWIIIEESKGSKM